MVLAKRFAVTPCEYFFLSSVGFKNQQLKFWSVSSDEAAVIRVQTNLYNFLNPQIFADIEFYMNSKFSPEYCSKRWDHIGPSQSQHFSQPKVVLFIVVPASLLL